MSAPAATSTWSFALIGNPNAGKTTIFNALTGLRQKVGNYPGVTVEKKMGQCLSWHGNPMQVLDLPGTYSLSPRSPDEGVTRDVLLGHRDDTPMPDRVICVVDASNLERNLYLVSQVLDLGLPTILALNMIDLAEARGVKINVDLLSKELGIPVIACQANTGKGVTELRLAMSREDLPMPVHQWKLPEPMLPAINDLSDHLAEIRGSRHPNFFAESILLLTESTVREPKLQSIIDRYHGEWEKNRFDWREAVVSARYQHLQDICEKAIHSPGLIERTISDHLDEAATHPIWGWVIFIGLMSIMFLSIFTLAHYPMEWINSLFDWISDGIKAHMAPGDLRNLITDGVIAGVGGVVVFLPQILILFFFIGLLEDTGYMARAAFIMDRVMSRVGLHGKSFIPLLSSYACAIPGIMATRTIENPKDRLATILVAPLMSCSARLPVYTLMIATLFPTERVPVLAKVGILMAMYSLGTLTAFFFAWLFKKTIMRGEPPVLIMELPPYRRPVLKTVALHMFERARLFLKRAGTVILGLSILLWFLTAYPKSHSDDAAVQLSHSFAGKAGHFLEPAIKPLGFDWKIGIGLIGSFAAREVFVSTMAIVYSVEDANKEQLTLPLRNQLLQATWPNGHPVFTPLTCISLMVFYVFAMQCISTVAVVKRETNGWKWPLFQIVYMTGFAYLASLVVYQIGQLLGFA